MSNPRFKEIEFKYATELPFLEFQTFAESLAPVRYVEASGYDYYFTPENAERFIRYRAGDRQELTTKEKTHNDNNYVRTEHNLLLAHGQPLSKIAAFVGSLGFPRLNFKIFKSCFIYYYEKFDLVYYFVLDENMKELNRFIEIEMLEDYNWDSVEQAKSALVRLEKRCSVLGIGPQLRDAKSLFERYRKA